MLCVIFFTCWLFKSGGGGLYYAGEVLIGKEEEEGCSSVKVGVAYEGWLYYVDHFR